MGWGKWQKSDKDGLEALNKQLRELSREFSNNLITKINHIPLEELKQKDNIKPLSPTLQDKLFHSKISSAFKVTNVRLAQNLFNNAVSKGWRWIFAGFIDLTNPVMQAKDMPALEENDWVIVQGKTLHLIKSNDDNKIARLVAEAENSTNILSNRHAEINLGKSLKTNIEILPVIELPKIFFKDSYVRLAGAYIRRLERLPKLKTAFNWFFTCNLINQNNNNFKQLSIKLYGKETSKIYDKYLAVILNNNKISISDIPHIQQLLGYKIRPEDITESSTIQNTIPLKKILEVLTVYDPVNDHDTPLVVDLNIFGGEKYFVLSGDANKETQLTVSLCKTSVNGMYSCLGNTYSHWINNYHDGGSPVDPLVANHILNQSIDKLTNADTNWQKIIEFLVCTQVVEAHCIPDMLSKSRVPGSGKLARSLIKNAAKNKISLAGSFDIKKAQSIFFPMAGTDGTSNGRKAVNTLVRNNIYRNAFTGNVRGTDNAPDYDMSEDSDV